MENLLPSEVDRCLCRVLLEARHKAGLTQKALGEKLLEGQAYIAKIENGHRHVMARELPFLCRALGLNTSDFGAQLDRELASVRRKRVG